MCEMKWTMSYVYLLSEHYMLFSAVQYKDLFAIWQTLI